MVSEALAEAVVAGELLMESVSDKLCWRRGVVVYIVIWRGVVG